MITQPTGLLLMCLSKVHVDELSVDLALALGPEIKEEPCEDDDGGIGGCGDGHGDGKDPGDGADNGDREHDPQTKSTGQLKKTRRDTLAAINCAKRFQHFLHSIISTL